MDDDFIGSVEFNLTPEQSEIVSRAIELASRENDTFGVLNPLIAIMQWWTASVPDAGQRRRSPEGTLAEACRLYVSAHGGSQ
jgi:hypothetical protein